MTDNLGRDKLRSYAERLTRLDDERIALVEDIRNVKAEAAGEGYSVKALTAAIKRANLTPEKRQEAEQYDMDFDLYLNAIQGDEE